MAEITSQDAVENNRHKSRCPRCGSGLFLIDAIDTIEVALDKDGCIVDYGKVHVGELYNLNCAKCGYPLDTYPHYFIISS